MKIAALLLILASLPACKTGASPEAGAAPIVDAGGTCSTGAVHRIALAIIDDVGRALVAGDWMGAFTDLVRSSGQAAVSCAVQAVAGQSNHNFQASGDELERLKTERGRAYLSVHPAGN